MSGQSRTRNELSGVLCKEFNVRETVQTAWLSFDDINCTKRPLTWRTFRCAYCIGGVDLSITTDLTCRKPAVDEARRTIESISRKCTGCPLTGWQERVQQDKIPYDKWFDHGLLRLCAGNSINYSDVTAVVHGNGEAIRTVPGMGVL